MKTAGVVVLTLLAVSGVGAGAWFLLKNSKKKPVAAIVPPVAGVHPVRAEPIERIPNTSPTFQGTDIFTIPRNEKIISDVWQETHPGEKLTPISEIFRLDPPKQNPFVNDSRPVVTRPTVHGAISDHSVVRLPEGVVSPVHHIVPQPTKSPDVIVNQPHVATRPRPTIDFADYSTVRPAPIVFSRPKEISVPDVRPEPRPTIHSAYRDEVAVGGYKTNPNTEPPEKHIRPHVDVEPPEKQVSRPSRPLIPESSSGGHSPSRKGFVA